MKELFEKLELYPMAYEVVRELNNKYDLCVVSIGTFSNIQYKAEYLKYKLPYIKNAILINNGNSNMNKSMVRTPEESIFMDDVSANLDSVTSRHKYIFGVPKPWNIEGNKYNRLYNYLDVANEFLK